MRVLVGEAMTLSSIDGQYRGPTPSILPVNSGLRRSRGDDLVGARVGMRDPAWHLAGVLIPRTHKEEKLNYRHRSSPGWAPQLAEVDRAAIKAWRGTGLQPSLRQTQVTSGVRTQKRGGSPARPPVIVLQAHVDPTVQERPGCENDGVCR